MSKRMMKTVDGYIVFVNSGEQVIGILTSGNKPNDIIIQNLSVREIFKDVQSYDRFLKWLSGCRTAIK